MVVCKIVTKSGFVTKKDVTKSGLHCTYVIHWKFQTNTGQSAMGIGAPVICGQNTGQHSKLEELNKNSVVFYLHSFLADPLKRPLTCVISINT